MSTLWDAKESIWSIRKRLKLSSSKAKTARQPFGNMAEKEMQIPRVYDAYNHIMGEVDLADQLQGHNGGYRLIKRGGTQAIDQFLLLTALVNCYLLSLYSNWPGEERTKRQKYRSQTDFRIDLIEALFEAGKDAQVLGKRAFSYTNAEAYEVPLHQHEHVKMSTRRDCAACKGVTHADRPPKRVALGEIAAN
jgi:hypothetical protein